MAIFEKITHFICCIMKYTMTMLLCTFLLITACTSEKNNQLSDYPEMKTIFSKKELADLQTLLNLFEKEIGISSDASPEAKAAGYSVFNKQVVAWYESGERRDFPLTEEQISKMFDMLHVGTFRSVWNIGVRIYTNGNQRPDISIHTQGKFMDLLSKLGKEYPPLTELHDNIKMAGDISPSFAVKLFKEFDQHNFQDARIRLVYAISCLRGEWKNLKPIFSNPVRFARPLYQKGTVARKKTEIANCHFGLLSSVIRQFLYPNFSNIASTAIFNPSGFLPPAVAKCGCPPPPPWMSLAASRTMFPA